MKFYLALDRSKSLVTNMRRPSSLKNRWFPLDMMPHFLDGLPPLRSLKCSVSTAPSKIKHLECFWINKTNKNHILNPSLNCALCRFIVIKLAQRYLP